MKKSIFYTIFTFIFFFGYTGAKAQTEYNKFDNNGKRHGIWKKYWDNNRIRYHGVFSHGKEKGTFKYYSPATSEFPIIIKEYHSNDGIADVKFYTEKGTLESEGKMNGKKRIGTWLYYHTDGKSVMSEENYTDGKLDGEYKTFYPDGSPTETAYYKNGKLEGNYKKYAIKGHLIYDFNYRNGMLNGKAAYYSRKTGDLIKKGQFKDDLRVGIWENYVDGELVSTEQPAIKPKREKE
jgi:antitoxin component YwqK of YwqJK toxin-antitoxin module